MLCRVCTVYELEVVIVMLCTRPNTPVKFVEMQAISLTPFNKTCW